MNIKASLTRKIGPLPAWGWLSIFAVAIYWYRHRAGATTQQGTATDTASIGPYGEDFYPQQGGSSGSSGGSNGGPPTITVNVPGGGKGKRHRKHRTQHTSTDKSKDKKLKRPITTTLGKGKPPKGSDSKHTDQLGSTKARKSANQKRGQIKEGGHAQAWNRARSDVHQNNARSRASSGSSRGSKRR